jgi:hypothetical protein
MRTLVTVLGLVIPTFLALLGGPAAAAPLSSHRVAASSIVIQTNGQRVHRDRVHRHRAHHRAHRHHAKHGYRHRKCRRGWLPPLPRYRHAPGKWSHKHCHDWHRCHYYFYGYKQWARWNPDKSRAYFYRRYHH